MQQNNYKWPLINNNVSSDDKKVLCDFIANNERLTNGPKVKEFEKKWSDWLGVKYSVMVNSGAMANYLSIAILKEIKGRAGEIIVPPIGWVSDVSSIINNDYVPVFSDVNLSTLSIGVESVKSIVNKNTKGIVLIHCLGFDAISDELLSFIKERKLFFIEDCCESHGAKHKQKKVGAFGDISCFSFYYGHHMTTIEGGMLCTNNNKIYELAKLFRSHGMTREANQNTIKYYEKKYPELNPLFTFAVPGYNVRSTELNAVLGIEQLKRLDDNIMDRKKNYELWISSLDSKKYYTKYKHAGNSNFALPLILNQKSKTLFLNVQKVLLNENVEYRVGTAGGGNQALQPYLSKYKFKCADTLKNANHIHFFGLYIGNYPGLKNSQIIDLCKKLNKL